MAEPLLDPYRASLNHEGMRRVLSSLGAAVSAALLAVASAAPGAAQPPWFATNVGDATQVLSVVSTGGSTAKMDVWQRGATDGNPWVPASRPTSAPMG